MVREFEAHVGLYADGSEPGACFRYVSPSLSAPPLLVLFLSLSKIKTLRKKHKFIILIVPEDRVHTGWTAAMCDFQGLSRLSSSASSSAQKALRSLAVVGLLHLQSLSSLWFSLCWLYRHLRFHGVLCEH